MGAESLLPPALLPLPLLSHSQALNVRVQLPVPKGVVR